MDPERYRNHDLDSPVDEPGSPRGFERRRFEDGHRHDPGDASQPEYDEARRHGHGRRSDHTMPPFPASPRSAQSGAAAGGGQRRSSWIRTPRPRAAAVTLRSILTSDSVNPTAAVRPSQLNTTAYAPSVAPMN